MAMKKQNKLNKLKTGGNTRLAIRTKARAIGSFSPIFFGRQQLGVNTIRSLNKLLQKPKRVTQKVEILREWKKVRKRMADLIAEGYTFEGRLQDIYNGFLHNTKRELEFLKQMTKRELRVLSAAYKGIHDIREKNALLNKERATKRMEKRRREKEQQEIMEQERMLDDEYLAEMGAAEREQMEERRWKLQNIIGDEEDYRAYIEEWSQYIDPDRQMAAVDSATQIIEKVNALDEDAQDALIDFWENYGGIFSIIQQAESKYYGYLYDALKFNLDILEMISISVREGDIADRLRERATQMRERDYHFHPATRAFGDSSGYGDILDDEEDW